MLILSQMPNAHSVRASILRSVRTRPVHRPALNMELPVLHTQCGRIPASMRFGLLALIVFAPAVDGQSRAIDVSASVITVRVFKSGLLSAFGHNHEITARIAAGTVDVAGRRVEFHSRAASLRVQDPGVSEQDRSRIQSTMLGPEVLDVDRFPDIGFRSSSAEPAGGSAWTVRGDLTLHGQTRPISVDVRQEGGHYVGAAQIKQTDFGMKPVKVAGGTVRVKDEVRIEFDIQLVQ